MDKKFFLRVKLAKLFPEVSYYFMFQLIVFQRVTIINFGMTWLASILGPSLIVYSKKPIFVTLKSFLNKIKPNIWLEKITDRKVT